MAKIAILGHATRGKEVIEILEMLGGVNRYAILDARQNILYTIRNFDNFIIGAYPTDTFVIFTLEEFLEKYPYKVGDKVIYEDKRREITKMVWEEQTNTVAYKLDDKLYCNVVNKLQPYKEETMETITIDDFKNNTKEWLIDKLHGMIISNAIKTIGDIHTELHKPKYPKTYEECCRVVNANPRIRLVYDLSDGQKYSYDADNLRLYESIRKLIICRDAYWKIAGEQMGLGKSWKPDWNDDSQFKNVLICRSNNIIKYAYAALNAILAFPTEEMRDTFYENFKDLIEECKEFL